MRKFLLLLLALCVILSTTIILTSCMENDPDTSEEQSKTQSESTTEPSVDQVKKITITYRQGNGFPDVIREVEAGKRPDDIPEPQAEAGYEILWEYVSYSSLTEDRVVVPVRRILQYKLTIAGAVTSTEIFTVEDLPYTSKYYDAESFLLKGYDFEGWYIDEELQNSHTGIITEVGNITLYAKAEKLPLSYSFNSEQDGYYVKSYSNLEKHADVVIPELVNGKSVIGIDYGAFRNAKNLKSVVIPNTVKYIGSEAFMNSGLESIDIPSSVLYIRSSAFSGCASLESATIDATISAIEEALFENCTSLQSITLPSSIEAIGKEAFYRCKALDITLSNTNIKSIGESALAGTKITALSLPATIEQIGKKAFASCTSLQSVTLPEGITAIGSSAFEGCTLLESIAFPSTLKVISNSICKGCTSMTSVVIPEGVEMVYVAAFGGTKIKTVTFPSTLLEIPSSSFEDNYELLEIYNLSNVDFGNVFIGENVLVIYTELDGENHFSTIGDYDFYELNGEYYLTDYNGSSNELILPQDVNDNKYKIMKNAFSGYSTEYTVVISSGVSEIEARAFSESKLVGVTFENGVTKIGTEAFKNTILGELTLPASLTTIEKSAFSGTGMTSLTFATNENELTIGEYAFYSNDKLISVDFSNAKIASIGKNAFYTCSKLEEVKLADTIRTIPSGCFLQCESLAKINLPEGLEYISGSAFQRTAFTELSFPSTLKSIGGKAFEGCDMLDKVTFGTGELSISSYAFDSCKLTELEIPSNVTVYEYAFNYAKIKTLKCDASLTESSFSNCSYLERVIFGDSIVIIPELCFEGCNRIYSVTLGKSIEAILDNAFSGCEKIFEIYNFSKLTITSGDIENNGAIAAYALAIYTEDDETEHIFDIEDGKFVFYKLDEYYFLILCREASGNLVLPSTDFDYMINSFLLHKADYINSVTIPDCVIEIGPMAIAECNSLTSITVGDNVTYIGVGAFMANPNLTSITLGESVEIIEGYAFSACLSLKHIAIPGSVKEIGAYAFYGSAFATIIFESTENWYVVNADGSKAAISVISASQNAASLTLGSYYNKALTVSTPSIEI